MTFLIALALGFMLLTAPLPRAWSQGMPPLVTVCGEEPSGAAMLHWGDWDKCRKAYDSAVQEQLRKELQERLRQKQFSGQVLYCPVAVERGEDWIDHFPLTVRNVGNATAVGVEITELYPVTTSGGGITTMSSSFAVIPKLTPGQWVSWNVPKWAWQHSWSARASGCVPVGQ
jgi:hypothetical protein